ncbi:unnamed protein product [Prunus brigantina]
MSSRATIIPFGPSHTLVPSPRVSSTIGRKKMFIHFTSLSTRKLLHNNRDSRTQKKSLNLFFKLFMPRIVQMENRNLTVSYNFWKVDKKQVAGDKPDRFGKWELVEYFNSKCSYVGQSQTTFGDQSQASAPPDPLYSSLRVEAYPRPNHYTLTNYIQEVRWFLGIEWKVGKEHVAGDKLDCFGKWELVEYFNSKRSSVGQSQITFGNLS